MCGTCKFCMGIFQIAAIGSAGMMLTVTSIFYIYGGMPPTFAMAIGFWIQYAVGWLSIYLTFYVVRVLGKGLFTTWTPRYCFILIIAVIIMYLAGSICFFVPVSKSRMIEYSRWYNRTNKQIPRFINKFQEQYQCCGINNYKDYNDPGIFGTKEIRARVVYAELNADDAAWTANQEELIEELSRTKKDEDPKLRKHLYFNVPNTCCKYGRRIKYKHCGRFVEYSRVEYTKPNVTKSHPNAVRIVNNVTGGCFEKYETVMSNSMFQLNWLIGIVRWGSLAQCVIFFILIWIYRLSLRAMRRDMRGDFEEERLFHDEGENPQQRSKATLQNKDNLLETEIKGVSSNMTLKSE